MIPFALERNGFGVTSGIKATAGARYIFMINRIKPMVAMTPTKERCKKAMTIKGKTTMDKIIPSAIKGIRLPKRPLCLSDRLPNIGSMKMAITLSSAIMIPTMKAE